MDALTATALLDLAEDVGPRLRGLDAKALFERLAQRHDELLVAMRWFLDEGRTDDALRLGSALAPFWTANKLLDEGSACLERALAAPGGSGALRGQAFFDQGLLVFWTGDDDRAATLHRRALEIGREIGEPTVIAQALTGLARVALRADVAAARDLCREALAVTEGTTDRLGRSNAMHVLGVAAQMAGDFTEARTFMTARIDLAEQLGNMLAVAAECGNLSMVERQLGNLDRAEELAHEALEIIYRRGDGWALPYALSGLAAVATDRGAFERAAILLGAAEAMIAAAASDWPPDERPHYERMLAALPAGMGPVAFDRARATGRAMTPPEAVTVALATRSAS